MNDVNHHGREKGGDSTLQTGDDSTFSQPKMLCHTWNSSRALLCYLKVEPSYENVFKPKWHKQAITVIYMEISLSIPRFPK